MYFAFQTQQMQQHNLLNIKKILINNLFLLCFFNLSTTYQILRYFF